MRYVQGQRSLSYFDPALAREPRTSAEPSTDRRVYSPLTEDGEYRYYKDKRKDGALSVVISHRFIIDAHVFQQPQAKPRSITPTSSETNQSRSAIQQHLRRDDTNT